MWSYISPLLFYLNRFDVLSRSAHTINYIIIFLLMYLHPELLLLLHLPSESTNFPHLITLHLDLVWTKSKYPFFIALLDLSYLTYRGTTFCSPYSWHNDTFCLPTYCIIVLLNYLTFTNCIFQIHFLFTSLVTLFIYPLVMSYSAPRG